MQVHFTMNHLPEIRFPVVTMGSFDGVHAGHRVIIARLNKLAAEAGGESVLITFHPHPRKVLYPDSEGKGLKLITTLREKCKVLEETGLAHLIILEFTKDFARISSGKFVEEYLVRKLHPHTIVVGFNHYFGYNKEGSFESLLRAQDKYGFKVEQIPEHEIQHETVSSTKIRKALAQGNIQRANACLEHHFMIQAELLPIPAGKTQFNRDCLSVQITESEKLIPPGGSYAVSVQSGKKIIKGLVRISGEEIYLYPLEGCAGVNGERPVIRFHKHIQHGELQELENEISAVEDLIY